MTTDPMTEAVEAAAKHLARVHFDGQDCDPTSPGACSICYGGGHMDATEVAQAAIQAALPILRTQFAEEVATAIEAEQTAPRPSIAGYDHALGRAARIARNWGTK